MKLCFNIFLFGFVCACLFSCSEPTLIGSDLINPDDISIKYKDDFNLSAYTIQGDSVTTNSNDSEASYKLTTLLLGELDDPFFGKTKSSAYFDVHLNSIIPRFTYTENGMEKQATLDSIVMVLPYDTAFIYGDPNATFDLKVYTLNEELPDDRILYSNEVFAHSMMEVGGRQFVPRPLDTVEVYEPVDTISYVQHLRIPMDMAFGEMLMIDADSLSSDSTFTSMYGGFLIEAETSSSSMTAIDFDNNFDGIHNRLQVYYTDTIQKVYRFLLDGNSHVHFDHDQSGSVVESFLDDPVKGDSLLFIQSMAGPRTEIDLSDLYNHDLTDLIVNKAEIEFFVAELPGDDFSLHPPMNNILASKMDTDSTSIVIEDLLLALNLSSLEFLFDGFKELTMVEGVSVYRYNINVTEHVQAMLNPDVEELSRINIESFSKQQRPGRSIIFGPGHSTLPLRLKLTYTEQN